MSLVTKTVEELLNEIKEEQLRSDMLCLHTSLAAEYAKTPAAVKHHHTDAGGLVRHMKEVMNIAVRIYDMDPSMFDATRDDVIVSAYAHDLNKIGEYKTAEKWKTVKYNQLFDKADRIVINDTARVVKLCNKYKITLSDRVLNAITFHHGSWSVDCSPQGYFKSFYMRPLAVLIHSADLMSAFLLGRDNIVVTDTEGDMQ